MEQLGLDVSMIERRPSIAGHRSQARHDDPSAARNAMRCVDRRRQDAQARRLGAGRHRFQERQAPAPRKSGRRASADHDSRRAGAGSRTRRARRTSKRIDLVRSRNPYQLDTSGACCCRVSRRSCSQASTKSRRRTGSRPSCAFLKLDVKSPDCRCARRASPDCKPFGYDLFKDTSSTFAPVGDVPVPSDYIVGPGDQLIVQLFGSQNRNLRLTVGRDGRISFPELGPINVGGQHVSSRVATDHRSAGCAADDRRARQRRHG